MCSICFTVSESELSCVLSNMGQKSGGQAPFRTYFTPGSSDGCEEACHHDYRCDYVEYYYNGSGYICNMFTAEEVQISNIGGYTLFVKACSLGMVNIPSFP